MKQQNFEELESIASGAVKVNLSYWTFQRAVKRGEVPSVRLPGNRVGVRLEDAQAYAALRAK